MEQKVRVRFAPSPTGHLHVGGARTALFNYLYARNRGGDFILRIEDTDQARSTKESEKIVLNDLKWLNLDWNEGPDNGGEFGPYRQSERMDIYKEHAFRLLEEGKAYRCFCTDEELETKKEAARTKKESPHYDGTCRCLSEKQIQEKVEAGIPYTIRFHVPEKDYVLYDVIRGKVEWKYGVLGDFIILRSDGMPVYNFCVVVDDHLMEISHVIRAEEHLPNTLRQMMLYEAFDWKLPKFAHASLILGQDKSKLSKRHGATSVGQFEEDGYLPEAMVNYMALLGWSEGTDKEIYKKEELIKAFSIKRINKSPAVFDTEKLNWINSEYIKALSKEEIVIKALPFIFKAFPFLKEVSEDQTEWIAQIAVMVQKRLTKLSQVKLELAFLFNYNLNHQEMTEFMQDDDFRAASLLLAERILELGNDVNVENFWEAANSIKQDGYKGKKLFHSLRALISGSLSGPDMDVMTEAIINGKDIKELVTIQDRCSTFIETFRQ